MEGASHVASSVKNLPNAGALRDEGSTSSVKKILREWVVAILQYLPAKFHGMGAWQGCRPWGCKAVDTTEHITNRNVCITRCESPSWQ